MNLNNNLKNLDKRYTNKNLHKTKTKNKSSFKIKDNLNLNFTKSLIIKNELKFDLDEINNLLTKLNNIHKSLLWTFKNKIINMSYLKKYFLKLKNDVKNSKSSEILNKNKISKTFIIKKKCKYPNINNNSYKRNTIINISLNLPKTERSMSRRGTKVLKKPVIINENIKNPIYKTNFDILDNKRESINMTYNNFKKSLNVKINQKEKKLDKSLMENINLKSYEVNKISKINHSKTKDFKINNKNFNYFIKKIKICLNSDKIILGIQFEYFNIDTSKVKKGKIHGYIDKINHKLEEYNFKKNNKIVEINFNYNSYLSSIILKNLNSEWIIIGNTNIMYDPEAYTDTFNFSNAKLISNFMSYTDKNNRLIKFRFDFIN